MFEKFYSLFGTKLIHDDVAVLILYFETQTRKSSISLDKI